MDKNRNIVDWNTQAEKIIGFKAEEVIGKECIIFADEPCKDKCFLFADNIPVIIILMVEYDHRKRRMCR